MTGKVVNMVNKNPLLGAELSLSWVQSALYPASSVFSVTVFQEHVFS